MAVMKKKGNKGLPPISTASLPDVIFMILFFFMVSTTMRDQELLVRYKLPEATEVQKLEKKSLVSYIHIGQPSLAMQAKFGTKIRGKLFEKELKSRLQLFLFCRMKRDFGVSNTNDTPPDQNANSSWPISWLKVSRWCGVRPYSRIARRCSRVG